MAEQENGLQQLFIEELRDIYDAEKQIVRALPRMIKASTSEELRNGFETHLEETRGQVDRLDQAFQQLDMRSRGRHCSGMEGILEEGKEMVDQHDRGEALDAGLIAAAQRVEHYEISVYGTLVAWARQLGHEDVASLLEETLQEEKATDEKLTNLAERSSNPAAVSSQKQARGRR